MKKSRIILVTILGFTFFFLLLIILGIFAVLNESKLSEWGKEKVGIIYINGIIMGGKGGRGFFEGTNAGSETIMEQIKSAGKDKDVKAVVIRINSPGGSVAASQEIYQSIKWLRKTKGKPVVASLADLSASGGYYVACAADKIVANPGSLTGSIGAIWGVHNLKELYKKIGIKFEVIKSGKYKDIGSPIRELTPEERKILQNLIDDVYNQFVKAVAEGRGLEISYVKKFADGQVFTGQQAKRLKLVDKLGNLQYAIRLAGEMGGIKGEPAIREYGTKGSYWDLLFSKLNNEVNKAFGLLFLMKPDLIPKFVLKSQ